MHLSQMNPVMEVWSLSTFFVWNGCFAPSFHMVDEGQSILRMVVYGAIILTLFRIFYRSRKLID